ncbi:MAG: metallopeptidase family protein [Deltaproteobacteria bacterium]|nr:metallopeptidase family protein [Deltaproteobacteria bacterium]
MERSRFESLVDEVFEELPEVLLDYVDNAVFVVEDWPDAETLESLGVRSRGGLLGLYQGLPLDERHVDTTGALPDRIVLYQKPIELYARQTGERVDDVVYDTLVHEIGHHFGLTEAELREIEGRG